MKLNFCWAGETKQKTTRLASLSHKMFFSSLISGIKPQLRAWELNSRKGQ
jgi:hypothetical protein